MYHYSLQNLEQAKIFAQKMASRLTKGGCVLFFGDLGAGKTALTKLMIDFLDKKIKVKSPTYSLMRDYHLAGGQDLYHLDLYRLSDFDEIYQIGYQEIIDDVSNIVIIEWAERLPDVERPIPRYEIHIREAGETVREVELNMVRSNQISKRLIEAFLDEFHTPINVRRHAELVARVAQQVGERLIAKGEIVDLQLLYEASMLHDLMRVVDFKDLDRENMQEDVTEEKWQTWNTLREKYKGQSHAVVAQEILTQRGYSEVANIIRKHCTSCILGFKSSSDLVTWEDKLLYYADKRVKHDKIVSMETRFQIGRDENGHLIKSLADSVEIEARANDLEREIFEIIGEDALDFNF